MPMKKYLQWIREQDCMMCGTTPCDPHHIKGRGNFSGVGMKAPDLLVMPLCRRCHGDMHSNPSLWEDQWEYIVRTLLRASQEGIINVR